MTPLENLDAANEIERMVGDLFRNVGSTHQKEFTDVLRGLHSRIGEMIQEKVPCVPD